MPMCNNSGWNGNAYSKFGVRSDYVETSACFFWVYKVEDTLESLNSSLGPCAQQNETQVPWAVARGLKASIPTRCVLPRHTDFDPIPKVRTRARGFLKRYGARLLLLSCSRIYPWGRRSHAVGAEHSTSRIAVTSQSSKRLRCRIVGYADTRKRLPRRELAQSWIGRPWVLRGSLPAEKVGTGSLHASWLNQQT